MFPVRRLVLTLWLGFNLTLVCQGHASLHGPGQTEPHLAFLGEPADKDKDMGTDVGAGVGPYFAATSLPGPGSPVDCIPVRALAPLRPLQLPASMGVAPTSRSQPAYATTALPAEGPPAVVHMVQTEQGAMACPALCMLCDNAHGRVCSRMMCGPDPPPPRA